MEVATVLRNFDIKHRRKILVFLCIWAPQMDDALLMHTIYVYTHILADAANT